MSQKLMSLSPDLKKLRDEQYDVEIKKGNLFVHSVPYVNSKKEVVRGTLVSGLDLVNDRTEKPRTHVVSFIGERPCNFEGVPLTGLGGGPCQLDFGDGPVNGFTFSSKPADPGYADYYEKMTTYIKILSSQAQVIDPSVSPITHKVITSDPESVFHYMDTNSSRADINAISAKLENLKIAIIGLGGTGSYILDFVAKTPVKEIHVFDQDTLLQHNAFRMPGAISGDKLGEKHKKVRYHEAVYSQLRKNIVAHECHITESNLDQLNGMDFVFISVDKAECKRVIIDNLIAQKTPFIDVGIGVHAIDGALSGHLRTTTCNNGKADHIDRRISFSGGGANDYSQNIQIAELNALNAALAVIKWKKLYGFYHDLGREYNSVYAISSDEIINDEIVA